MNKHIPTSLSPFSIGDPLPEQFSRYFTGQAYLAPLTSNDALHCPVHNVTFEPSCRNNWHAHSGGQLLIAMGGRGYYQEQGTPARLLVAGDIVEIAPDVVHWHGAAPDSWFSHLAIATNPERNVNSWLEAVDDRQYAEAIASAATVATTASAPVHTAMPRPSRATPEAQSRRAQWFSSADTSLWRTDPELMEVFDNFAFDEVVRHSALDTPTRILVTLAATVAQHTQPMFRKCVGAALDNGISAVAIREVLYQAVAYVGMPRVEDLLEEANAIFARRGIALPLEEQATTTPDTRFVKGLALQKSIFGQQIDRMRDAAPEGQRHIQDFLSANCFGDYQTRRGLDTTMRELLTFAMLISLGGCEPQVKGHIMGNAAVGNGKQRLMDVITQLLPYNGYPRTLNAVACLNAMLPEKE